jgi:hypothetical protein
MALLLVVVSLTVVRPGVRLTPPSLASWDPAALLQEVLLQGVHLVLPLEVS